MGSLRANGLQLLDSLPDEAEDGLDLSGLTPQDGQFRLWSQLHAYGHGSPARDSRDRFGRSGGHLQHAYTSASPRHGPHSSRSCSIKSWHGPHLP